MSFPRAGPSAGHAGAAGLTFNPPPGWPRPPVDWVPPEGWQPDPAWPPAPEGWSFWAPAAGAPAAADPAGQGDGEIRVSLGGQSFTIRPGQEIRIGRSPENDIVVPDPAVSRQHGLVRHGLGGWEFAQTGSAPTFMNGEPVSQVTVDRAVGLALGTLNGPRLTLEPTQRMAPQPATVPDPSWRPVGASVGAAGGGAPDWTPEPAAYAPPSWGARPATAPLSVHPPGAPGDDMGNALRILFPVQSWLHNSGWRQGLRLGVIIYALLPLIFLTVLNSSTNLSSPGWAYSLYVAPLWLIGFWLLIRPPGRPGMQEIVIAVAIVLWTFGWLNTVTITINDRLSISNGINLWQALVIGLNEETSKALPILLAGLILRKVRNVKLDVRMWMIFGTIAGLTFGVTEQAIYTSLDLLQIAGAHHPQTAVQGALAFAERVFVDGFQHAVWAGISGFFMGLAINYRKRRIQLIVIGIGTPALLHAANDWLSSSSPWIWIAIQAASLLLFLGYTLTAASIEETVRRSNVFRGQSMIMEAIRLPDGTPRQ
ncbi:MAG TPA: PrsW family glutamic-type intramembrane protease [Trebonia sp.]|nr:PrsW family glutamic-type intramembrane protease [Trebonia sp.]